MNKFYPVFLFILLLSGPLYEWSIIFVYLRILFSLLSSLNENASLLLQNFRLNLEV